MQNTMDQNRLSKRRIFICKTLVIGVVAGVVAGAMALGGHVAPVLASHKHCLALSSAQQYRRSHMMCICLLFCRPLHFQLAAQSSCPAKKVMQRSSQ